MNDDLIRLMIEVLDARDAWLIAYNRSQGFDTKEPDQRAQQRWAESEATRLWEDFDQKCQALRPELDKVMEARRIGFGR